MAVNDLFRTPNDGISPTINPRTPRLDQPSPSSSAPATGYERELLTWIISAVKEGEAIVMVESQLEDVDDNYRIVMGDSRQERDQDAASSKPYYRSSYKMSRIGKNIDDIASALTDFRPIGQFKTYNTLYESQAQILDKLQSAWWHSMDIDLKIQLLVKESLIARTSYAQVVFNPTLHQGLGDIDLVIRDYRDVLPIRPNSKLTIQDAVGVIIRSKNTVNWGRARYSDKADQIIANNEGGVAAKWSQKALMSSPILDYLERQMPKKQTDFAIPTYDHYEIYIKDGSLNKSGSRKWVGPGPEDKNPWGYWVEPDKPLYPRGRLIVVCNLNVVLFDGGNPYWHGMFPIIKLTLNPYAKSFLGKSAIIDAKPAHKMTNELLCGLVDACRKALKPGLVVDRQAVNRQVLDNFDTSEPGFKLRTNPSGGQGIIFEPPPVIPPYVENVRNEGNQFIDHAMGVLDMRAMMQLKQLAGDIDVESLMEHLGPSVRTKGRMLEVFLRELGLMMRANFFQFYSVERRIEVLGAEGMDFEDFDFDPGSLVPAFMSQDFNSEKESSRFLNPNGEMKPRSERAQAHINSFSYYIAPNSLLSLAKTQDKLMYLQLFRMGVIDPITLLEKLEIPNIGELPGGPKTILERMSAAAQQGYVGAVSAAGRKSSGQDMPNLRSDGKMSESG